MKTQDTTNELLSRLAKPALAAWQVAHLLASDMKLRTQAPPWYLAFLLKCLETLALTAAGIALGIALVVIAHYTGIES